MAACRLSEALLLGGAGTGSLSRCLVFCPGSSRTRLTGNHAHDSLPRPTSLPSTRQDRLQAVTTPSSECGVRYVVNPARYQQRHSVCGLQDGPSLLYAPSTSLPQLTEALSPNSDKLLCHVTPPCQTAAHMTTCPYIYKERATPLDVRHSEVHVRRSLATPPPSHNQDRGTDRSDLPSPAQLSVILLKLREEVSIEGSALLECNGIVAWSITVLGNTLRPLSLLDFGISNSARACSSIVLYYNLKS